MITNDFEIRILRQHWVKDDETEDKEDLCSHGEVYIRIGTEVLSNKDSGSWTLSVTGLYLLRSINQDCSIDDFSNQLVPCCGHFMIPDEDGEDYVVIIGCPNGIDWEIKHKNGQVIFESKKGNRGILPISDYKKMILNFTNEIEEFYGDKNNKISPTDESDKKGFYQFWKEWNNLKGKLK